MNFLEQLNTERTIIINHLLQEHESRYGIEILEDLPRQTCPFPLESIARDKACAFTGHRPEKLQRSYEDCLKCLCAAIMDAYDQGYREFISGMARGVDLWAAHIILILRRFHPDVRLIAAVPYQGFNIKWDTVDQNIYSAIECQADAICIVARIKAARAYQLRNVWMIDHSSRLIACWDGKPGGTTNTIQYAKRMNKTIIMI